MTVNMASQGAGCITGFPTDFTVTFIMFLFVVVVCPLTTSCNEVTLLAFKFAIFFGFVQAMMCD